MPHHPSEEETDSNIFDKVAQESKDSTASDHPIHVPKDPTKDVEEESSLNESIHVQSSKGPVIPDKLPEKASKDELKARAAELNK